MRYWCYMRFRWLLFRVVKCAFFFDRVKKRIDCCFFFIVLWKSSLCENICMWVDSFIWQSVSTNIPCNTFSAFFSFSNFNSVNFFSVTCLIYIFLLLVFTLITQWGSFFYKSLTKNCWYTNSVSNMLIILCACWIECIVCPSGIIFISNIFI